MKKILIIEDDKDVREELKVLLCRNGYQADYVTEFRDVCKKITESESDMVLLDINLPDVDGESLLKELRKTSSVPVIMVTSKNTEMDEVLCLSFGADDFIAKPYNPSVLLLHIEAVFRRMGRTEKEDTLSYNDLVVDLGRGVMKIGDKVVELSKNEMGVLAYMLKKRGQIISRDELMNYLWDSEQFVDDNTLTVNINRVRKKLEECGFKDIIQTKRGQGYIIL